MKKIVSLFRRNYDGDRLVRDEVVPGAEWVAAGEGMATAKIDGTCCLVRDGRLYKRLEIPRGKTPPPGFEPASEVDPETGKQQGWLAVGDGPEDRWHREAADAELPDGTYELVGPKIQGNAERHEAHVLIAHGVVWFDGDPPRDYLGLRAWLDGRDVEGIVWYHPDGRMVKIKGKDFGLRRPKSAP